MRKPPFLLITFFALLTIIIGGCSHSKNEHLTFMDISMGQTVDKFTKDLKDKGFQHITKENGMTIMEGMFSGVPVQIAIFETTETKRVAMIAVEFPTESDRSKARDLYDQYSRLLDKKYTGSFRGKDSRYFQHLIESPDINQIHGNSNVTLGDYMTYFASWEVSKGEIVTRVYNSSQFQIIYADSINYESGINEIASKINTDL